MQLAALDRPLLAPGEPIPADLWATLGATPHPVAPLPEAEFLRTQPVAALLDYLNLREETIHRMAADPCRFGFEPFLWKILDAVCGFPWLDHPEAAVLAEPLAARRAALRAEKAWCLRVRRLLLRQDEPVKVLLLQGGNRGGKSEWAAARVNRLLFHAPHKRAWCLHQNAQMSRDYQQPLVYKYFPAELKTEKGIRKGTTYIAYKAQTGFPDEKFTLPNASDGVFKYYEQNIKSIEGGELDVIWCDELVPASWIETLKARVATRAGWLLITFTPVDGYSSTVKMFLDRAQTTRESIAYILPKDGGAPLFELALQGEDPHAWIGEPLAAAGHEAATGQPPAPPGREFERVKRIMRTSDRRTAIFFFHSFDNPFGNPRELWALYANATAEMKRMRFYGEAQKLAAGKFPRFGAAHIVSKDKIPRRGTRYYVMDPCSGRNWAMLWALVERAPSGRRIWIYREWPCPGVYVPGVGDLGAWAEPGDKHDGERGPAQRPLGWGLIRYRQEIHRLEGRPAWADDKPEIEKPFQWDQDDAPEYTTPRRRQRREHREGEEIYERLIDSRFAATPSLTREGQTTLLEECDKIGLEFRPASGRDIQEGIDLINDALHYREAEPLGPLNEPGLFVAEECANVIFALQNWTGEDGQHGACKDFVDLVRYLLLADPEDWSEDDRSTPAAA
jgi:phage terminase large subunit-like protein